MVIDVRSPEGLKEALATFSFYPDRRLGQNYLIERGVLERIARLALNQGPGPLLEIGAGPGALTATLLENGARVVAIEVDSRVIPVLEQLQEQFPDLLTIVEGDILQMSLGDVQVQHDLPRPSTVLGNLPYYITAPILAKFWEDTLDWDRAILMVQREVAERLLKGPGCREATALSVMLRYQADIHLGFHVSAQSFYPAPEVESTVVELKRREALPIPLKTFRWVVREGFKHRRKMIQQALAYGVGSPWTKGEWSRRLHANNVDPKARAESLTLDQWVEVARILDAAD